MVRAHWELKNWMSKQKSYEKETWMFLLKSNSSELNLSSFQVLLSIKGSQTNSNLSSVMGCNMMVVNGVQGCKRYQGRTM